MRLGFQLKPNKIRTSIRLNKTSKQLCRIVGEYELREFCLGGRFLLAFDAPVFPGNVALSRRLVFKEASPHQSFLGALLGIAIRGFCPIVYKIKFYLINKNPGLRDNT